MASTIPVDRLAEEVMKGLTEYADLATEDLKKSVRKAGQSVKKDISENAPKDTGAYAKSWAVKNTRETANSLEVTVYSRNRYQLAHLLEFGHAKQNGGRTKAFNFIAPINDKVENDLAKIIERKLQK